MKINFHNTCTPLFTNAFKYLLTAVLFMTALNSQAQRSGKTTRFVDFTVSPSLGLRVLANYKTPDNYYSTPDHFHDSLKKADRPGQSINLGVAYVLKKDNYNQITFGLSYVHKSFQRVRTPINVGDVIHKDVGVVAGIVQAGILEVQYNFNYKYLEGSMLWHSNLSTGRKLKDMDIWVFGGFAPNVLISDKMKIKSVGFTLDGKNTHWVYNPEFKAYKVNLDLRTGLRIEQMIYKTLNGIVQPGFRMPVLPAFHGAQTVWIPQLSLDVGLSFKLSKTVAK